ncbi:MAG TPA: DNA repair protein RecN [Acidobacteriaceae bacterium]|jgi:DNA repair protein RecN (Recombination protein N)|nr:DNA repair protein RecN [Acidobacteriaceae bacterium]
MLLELRAENYAVVDQAGATFSAGLNLLTGETGAGKSILIDALALLLGEKASADIVRHGADKAIVTSVFESTQGALAILEANGIDPAGEEIILRREIAAGGKGRVFVNNQPATVAVLRALAPELALVHAQSDSLGAFDHAQQRALLDRSAGISTDATAVAYSEWTQLREKLHRLEHDEQDRLRMADMWSFQKREIEQAHLLPAEDETLAAEKLVLANAEKLYNAAMGAHDVLYESASSAEVALRAGLRHLEELARYDPRWEESAQQLAAARATVSDLGTQARDFAEHIQSSPERLEEIEDRLALLDRLKRKYGATLDAVIAFGEEASNKLEEIENRDQLLLDLREQLTKAAEAYRTAAQALTKQREAAARQLAKRAEGEMNDLAMKARFQIAVTPNPDESGWAAHGWDTVECRIATNAGEPLRPLDQIASGGEMSRVLLALKVSVEESAGAAVKGRKKLQVPRTLVFDEIDIGIGGRAAEAVGRKLKALARVQQVLCITHLPQIAAFADQHFLIEKKERTGRTHTSVRQLTDQERKQEIARMLSGAKLTETSLQHAEQMLQSSR